MLQILPALLRLTYIMLFPGSGLIRFLKNMLLMYVKMGIEVIMVFQSLTSAV